MKPLTASNRYLRLPEARKVAVDRNVRSSSAIEGVSAKLFQRAADGRIVAKAKRAPKAAAIKTARSKK